MQKTYFHDKKHFSEKKVQKKTTPLKYIDKKRIVDINKLLNRVRVDNKNEIKRKILFSKMQKRVSSVDELLRMCRTTVWRRGEGGGRNMMEGGGGGGVLTGTPALLSHALLAEPTPSALGPRGNLMSARKSMQVRMRDCR
jgi:hypothetical protein